MSDVTERGMLAVCLVALCAAVVAVLGALVLGFWRAVVWP
jgi:hypothetical protein